MKTKLNATVAAAAALMAVSGAHAGISLPTNTSFGNSSVLFVAWDQNANISMVADLGINMADLLPGSALATAGAVATWNFNTNTSSLSGVTGNAWDAAFSTFKATQSGDDFRWGVIAADSIAGNVSGSNTILGRGMLATGLATEAQMLAANTSAPTGNALTAANNFWAAAQNLGTVNTANNGAGTATSGPGYLGTAMRDDFSGQLTWKYMVANGITSTMQYQQQVVADPTVFQIGDPTATNTLSSNPMTFRFDIATGDLVLAVPEPGTYAMLLAGLAVVTLVARRRKS